MSAAVSHPLAPASPESAGALPLIGRDQTIAALTTAVEDPALPIVLLTGAAGVGRTAVLAALANELPAREVSTIKMSVTRLDAHRPYGVIGRINLHLGEIGETNRAIAQLLTTGPSQADRLTAVLAEALRDRGPVAVLMDNAQWTDPWSRAMLEPLAERLAGTSVTIVCSVRSSPFTVTPETGDPAAVLRMEHRHVPTVRLYPIALSDSATLLARELEAHPSPNLVEEISALGAGLPGPMLAALEGYRRSGALRLVDGYAHLAAAGVVPELDRGAAVLEDVMCLPKPQREVMLALSVVYPMGSHALPLLAECTGQPLSEVENTLAAGLASGLLVTRPDQGWGFRLPLHALALPQHLGPYARRRTAQAAVTAIWSGAAPNHDSGFLHDQLAVAGPLMDRCRAGTELLKHGSALIDSAPVRAERWLSTAVELCESDAHMDALLKHARVCWVLGQWSRATDTINELLDRYGDWLGPHAAQESQFLYITSLRAMGDEPKLLDIVSDTWQSLGGGPAQQLVTTALALHCLGRFAESLDLLEMTASTWRIADDTTVRLGHFVVTAGRYLLGRCDTATYLAACANWPSADTEEPQEAATRIACLAEYILAVDDLNATSTLLGTDGDLTTLAGAWQVMVSYLQGHWDTKLDIARGEVAVGAAHAPMMGFEGMNRALARINLARAKPASARALIEKARSEPPASGYLVNCVEADLEASLGNREGAVSILRDGLGIASALGLALGTDELWVRLAELWAAGAGDVDPEECLREVGRIADTTGTGPARLNHLLTRLAVHRRPEDGEAAERIARELNQPYALANTLSRLAQYHLATADMVYEAYEIYGGLGALLPRAALRGVMRELKIPVPGRQETVAEQQLVLATLVTEGLSNREVAAILHDSEKSVEGRLSRLFRQTGYRSRVELATAVLTGTFSPEQAG